MRTESASVLLDCGPGAVHGLARSGVDWEGLTHVVVTHFHNDHIGDLPALLVALKHAPTTPRTRPLVLMGPFGFGDRLARLSAAHGDYVTTQAFPVQVIEIGHKRADYDRSPDLTLRSAPTPHTDESVCIRLEGAWGSVGYTGDTGPSAEVVDLLRGVDVLVSECTWTDPTDEDGHLTPRRVATLSREVAPELVVLTHVMPPATPEEAVASVVAEYHGRVVAGVDGLLVGISTDGVTVDPPGGAA